VFYNLYDSEQDRQAIKSDLVEISDIKYGLFNVDEWQKILAGIVATKIDELEIDPKSKEEMRHKVSDFLYEAIDDFDKRTHEKNKGVSGFFKNAVADVTDIFGRMKEDVPIFTEQVMSFIDDPNNREAVKGFLDDKLDEYAAETFAKMDYSVHDSIIEKYGKPDRATTIDYLNDRMNEYERTTVGSRYLVLALAGVTALFIFFLKKPRKIDMVLLILSCLIFLAIGLSLPMIEIDARIAEIDISLLGENILFQDQVLYYKSKSILQVVALMMGQGQADVLIVGIMVLAFSVLFPLSKLIASLIAVLSTKAKNNKVVDFLIHKTGKWSMADVMVVAIFMAYIGFSGILSEQLGQLENISTKIELLTTNESELQTGFFAFASFAVLGLLLSNKIK
jgi:hypothetical protein